MSIESAQAFIERVKTDEEFANKVTGCRDAGERKAFAAAEGFDFSVDEMQEARSVVSDDDLSISGGGGIHCNGWTSK